MTPLPPGFGLTLDRSLRRFRDGTVLAGGHPGRVVTLTAEGAEALDALVDDVTGDGPPVPPAVAALAARLVRSGMAHPHPVRRTADSVAGDVTVVVPAFDRPDALDRCLTSLGGDHPVVVVDDASRNPVPVAQVCAARGARLVRRDRNGGPGAARNEAVAVVGTGLVAFVDSDCTVRPGWLDGLTWLFADESVGAVAPRVAAAPPGDGPSRRAIDRFHAARSPLDLGPDGGEVGPGRAVPYVPTAALVVRRDALVGVGGFDPDLRVGEDVDLVWRLVDAGWRVRYEPTVVVDHAEPGRWRDLVVRRFRYGTSAAPLAARHPGLLAPVELRPWPTLVAVAALAGRPRTAVVALAVSAGLLARSLRPLGIPGRQAWTWSAAAAGWNLVGLGRASTVLAAPGLVALAARGRRGAGAALALVVVPPVVDWVRRHPDLDPARWVAASVVDDVAYGVGVWTGCLRTGSYGALLPSTGGTATNRDHPPPQI